MKKPIFDEKQKRITPQQFGAVGDGKADDTEALRAAAEKASRERLVLELPQGDYYTAEVVEWEDLTVLSHNARISYYGLHKSRPAVNMHSNVNIFGTLTIWAIDNTKFGVSNHGNRAGMAFGVYDTGEGAHHCYVEDLVILAGGMPNANGVIITGDSSDITMGRVTVPAGTDVYRGVLVHWGNANDHFPLGKTWSVENGYGHAENWKPTKHPHDLHFGVIDCSGIEDAGISDSRAAFHIAAGYDIEAEEVIMNDGFHSVAITGADQGFLYADPEVQAVGGMRNLRIGRVVGRRLHDTGLYVFSCVLMEPARSVDVELEVGEVDLEAAPDCKKAAVNLSSTKQVKIGSAKIKGYGSTALYVGKNNRDVQIGELCLENCSSEALQVSEYAKNAPKSGSVRIGSVTAKHCGGDGQNAAHLHQFDTLEIGEIRLEASQYENLLNAVKNCDFASARVGKLNADDASKVGKTVNTEAAPQSADKITVGV